MSKTYDDQIKKVETLIAGYRKNLSLLKDKGVSEERLKKMETAIAELVVCNAENEKLRKELNEKTHSASMKLADVKDEFQTCKKIVKMNYPKEQWFRFGISDLR